MTTQPQQAPLPWIANLMLKMRECLCNEVAPTCWCGLYPGDQVPMEFCGECDSGKCGMAYVRLASAYPSSEFPFPDSDAQCVAPLAYQVAVGVMRCVPVANDDGSLPDPGDILTSTLAHLDDQQAVARAVRCCVTTNAHGMAHVMGEWQPIGPQGGCVGGEVMVTVTP